MKPAKQFVLDEVDNPHPDLLEHALLARGNARVAPVPALYPDMIEWRSYWLGQRGAQCITTE